MPQLTYDLVFSVTFIIILSAVLRFGKAVFESDMYAYKNIIIGLSFLTGFSLIQLGGHQGLFGGVPMLGESGGRRLIEAIGITAGLIFLLSGIGAWLPSAMRRKHEGQKLNKRYFCLKMISQSLEHDRPLNEVLERVAECLSTYLGIPRCAMYKYSARQEHLQLAASAGFTGEMPPPDDRLPLARSNATAVLPGRRPLKPTDGLFDAPIAQNADFIVPIGNSTRLYATLFCWLDGSMPKDDDLIDFLATLGALISRHAEDRVERTQRRFYQSQQTLYEQVNDICSHVSSVHDLIPGLYKVLKRVVGAEYMSLATLDNSGENMVRFTIGSTGRMLLEKGVSRQTQGTDVFSVYEQRRSILEPAVHQNDRSGEQDGLFLSCGMRSKMVCPVTAGKKVVAALTLGHSQPEHYTPFHLRRIEGLVDLVAGAVRRERLNRSMETKEDLMLRLQLIQRNLIDGASIESFFDQACDVLTRRMKCTMARISLLDKDRLVLNSHACRTIRPLTDSLRETEPMALSLLPWHRLTLDNRKLMLINQDDPESQMPPQESTTALIPEIKSAMLVPIRLGDEVKGIISIGEARNWNRRAFGATDLIFAKDVAAKCSLALQLKKMELDIDRGRERIARLSSGENQPWGQIRQQMKSPLTSIIGAVELLKTRGQSDEFSTRYHELIYRSANRIKTLTDCENIEGVDVDESAPEMVIG